MRYPTLASTLILAFGCAENAHRPIEPELSYLGGHAWIDATTSAAPEHRLVVAFRDRDGDGRLAPMVEPAFPCEPRSEGRAPECSVLERRVVVRSYSSTSSSAEARREGLAIWVQDASARPAAVPFCTQIGCSTEQAPFFDQRASGPQPLHQLWTCTPDPVGEVGIVEVSVGSETHRIPVKPHLRLEAVQQWRADGLHVEVIATEDVSRALVRVMRDGAVAWNSEESGAGIEMNGARVTTVIPEAIARCSHASCVIQIDAVRVWSDQHELVTSVGHLEQPLLASSLFR
jgi:hypothetical protein